MRKLTDYVRSWIGCRVLVVGDVMLDEYIYASANGVNPEDPDASLWRVDRIERYLGGAANAAMNLRTLGAKPIIIGAVGRDVYGQVIDSLLVANGIDSRLVVVGDQPTTSKIRLHIGGQLIGRLDEDQSHFPKSLRRAEEDRQLATEIRNAILLFTPSGILLSDYSKGVLSPEVTSVLAEMGDFVDHFILDPKRSTFGGLLPIDAVTPNRYEAASLGGPDRRRFFSVIPGLQAVIETRGKRGADLRQKDYPAFPVPIRNPVENPHVCGAGDTFAAALTLARIAGAGWLDSTYLANAAAKTAVRHPGTTAPSYQSLIAELGED